MESNKIMDFCKGWGYFCLHHVDVDVDVDVDAHHQSLTADRHLNWIE